MLKVDVHRVVQLADLQSGFTTTNRSSSSAGVVVENCFACE